MTFAQHLGLAYALLATLAITFLLLMAYWNYQKSVKDKAKIKFRKNSPICIYHGSPEAYICCFDGSYYGPFKDWQAAEDYAQKHGK